MKPAPVVDGLGVLMLILVIYCTVRPYHPPVPQFNTPPAAGLSTAQAP